MDREDLEDQIRDANQDDGVDGIIVYYPVFDSPRDRTLQWTVSLYKDVEGLSPQLISNMYQNIRFLDPPTNTRKSILPCTPLAVIKILEHLQIYNTFLDYGKRLFGRRITVINRSEVVGRPLAALLANDGAEVYSVDVTGVQHFSRGTGLKMQKHEVHDMDGWTLEQCLPISEVVISGVPGEAYKVPTSLIREGAVCINFSSEKASSHRFCFKLKKAKKARTSIPMSRRKLLSTFQPLEKSQLSFCFGIYCESYKIGRKRMACTHQQFVPREVLLQTNRSECNPGFIANLARRVSFQLQTPIKYIT